MNVTNESSYLYYHVRLHDLNGRDESFFLIIVHVQSSLYVGVSMDVGIVDDDLVNCLALRA